MAPGQLESRTFGEGSDGLWDGGNVVPDIPGNYRLLFSWAQEVPIKVVLPVFETSASVRLLPDGEFPPENDQPAIPYRRYRSAFSARWEGVSYICIHADDSIHRPSSTSAPGQELREDRSFRRVARSTESVASMTLSVNDAGIYTIVWRTTSGAESSIRVDANLNPIDAPPMYDDVTARIQRTTTDAVYSEVTGLFHSTVTIRNTGTTAIAGPIHALIDGLPSDVEVANPAGVFQAKPYISFNVASLAPNAEAQAPLTFRNPNNQVLTSVFLPILSGPIF